MSRHGGLIPVGNRAFIALVDPISPPSATATPSRLMVEAPGYCPPGPKCLFHLTIYRHSRLPGTPYIGFSAANRKEFGLAPSRCKLIKRIWNYVRQGNLRI